MKMFQCEDCGCETPNSRECAIGGKSLFTYHLCDRCYEKRLNEALFQEKGRTYGEDELICPWCQFPLADARADVLEEGTTKEYECPFCGRLFNVTVEVRRTYSTCRSLCEMERGEDDR